MPGFTPGTSATEPKPLTPTAADQLAEARAATIKAADARKAQAEKAAAAAKEASDAKKAAAAIENGTLERQVGLVDGTTKVFVDLVDPVRKQSVFRVFGPQETPALSEPAAPKTAAVTNAYTRGAASTPLKDVGVV